MKAAEDHPSVPKPLDHHHLFHFPRTRRKPNSGLLVTVVFHLPHVTLLPPALFFPRIGFGPREAGGSDRWAEQHQEAWRLPGQNQLQ